MRPKILVVYFSRTGHTRRLAELIADAVQGEVEEITETAGRRGVLGYLRSGNEAWFGRAVPIALPRHAPAAYDLVVIGSPVWRASLSSPVRAYLRAQAAQCRRLAFFCTMGRFGSERVFRQMQDLCGRVPVATLALTEGELASADLSGRVKVYASLLCGRVAPEALGAGL